MELRYGMNPQQATARIAPRMSDQWPVRVLHGQPSFINMLDALNAWQLVREAGEISGRPAAASFKHVSPAGAALAGKIDADTAGLYGTAAEVVSSVTSAYLRARDADPRSSYGDLAAVSQPVDRELAGLLARVVCDGVIAPAYEPGTIATLRGKKNGRFLVMEADPTFTPPEWEERDVFGLRMTQGRDQTKLEAALFEHETARALPPAVLEDLLLGLVTVRYTQSNSVCYVRDGATLGIGAGQQSRIDCTRLAGAKVDSWWLRRHPAIGRLAFRSDVRRQDRINWQLRFVEGDLTPDEAVRFSQALSAPAPKLTNRQRRDWIERLAGVSFVSDGALPFRDNVDHAHRHGVEYIAEPGGSKRSEQVEAACREHRITLARTGLRLFHH